jgi:hypothetical protein
MREAAMTSRMWKIDSVSFESRAEFAAFVYEPHAHEATTIKGAVFEQDDAGHLFLIGRELQKEGIRFPGEGAIGHVAFSGEVNDGGADNVTTVEGESLDDGRPSLLE